MIGAGTREGANDKVEIRRCEPLPTIRTNHREPSISIGRAAGKLRQFVEKRVPLQLISDSFDEDDIRYPLRLMISGRVLVCDFPLAACEHAIAR